MTETSQPYQRAILYKRSPTSLVVEEAAGINNSVSKLKLADRIAGTKDEIERYREQTGADFLEDSMLYDESADEEILFEWYGT